MTDTQRVRRQRRWDDVKSALRRVEALLEVILLAVTYYFIWKELYKPDGFYNYNGNGKYVLILVYALLVMILFSYCDSFKFGHLKLGDVLLSQIISILMVNVVTYFQLSLMANHLIRIAPMIFLTVLEAGEMLALCVIFHLIYHNFNVPRHMVMVYGNSEAVTLKFKMDTRPDKYVISRILSIDEDFDKVCRTIREYDAVVINDVPAQKRNDLLKFCYRNGIRTYLVLKISDIIVRGADDISLFDTPVFLVRGRGLTLTQRIVKRAMDLLISLLATVILSPLMLITAAAIHLEDGGPVFYRQTRVTKDGKHFEILKFRSMIVDAEKNGAVIPATGRDPRITKVGRIIRATRIDELPQILNIVKGDMSIVGPRPERVEHVEQYMKEIPEFEYRFKVRGGLTGYAQIYGKYNTSPYDKLRLDLMYIENYSLLMDIRLILMTVRIMFTPESTEGFEKVEELERRKDEILEEVKRNDGQLQ